MLCCANFLLVYSSADLLLYMHKIEQPAQLFVCVAVHSCANFWAVHTKLAQLEFLALTISTAVLIFVFFFLY